MRGLRRTVARTIVKRRRTAAFQEYLAVLERVGRLDPAGLRQWQAERLSRVLAAAATVPAYRERAPVLARAPDDAFAMLAELPVTRKADLLREPPQRLVARGADPQDLTSAATSGSSGQPLRFYLDAHFHDRSRAVRAYCYRELGYQGGQIIEFLERPGARGWRDPASPGFPVSVVHYRLPVEEQAALVRELRPEVLRGNRSVLLSLAEALARGGAPPSVRLVVSASEMLSQADRDRLQQVFSAPVHDFYGAAEVSGVAWECRPGAGYHVLEARVIVEVVRNGQAVEPGDTGEVVVTSLDNEVMPFVRYATGDYATLAAGDRPCGRPGLVLERIDGRADDWLHHHNGSLVNPWQVGTSAFWASRDIAPHVAQWQVLQGPDEAISVRVVPRGDVLDPTVGARIVAFVNNALGPLPVRVEETTAIPLEANGKFRPVKRLAA